MTVARGDPRTDELVEVIDREGSEMVEVAEMCVVLLAR